MLLRSSLQYTKKKKIKTDRYLLIVLTRERDLIFAYYSNMCVCLLLNSVSIRRSARVYNRFLFSSQYHVRMRSFLDRQISLCCLISGLAEHTNHLSEMRVYFKIYFNHAIQTMIYFTSNKTERINLSSLNTQVRLTWQPREKRSEKFGN